MKYFLTAIHVSNEKKLVIGKHYQCMDRIKTKKMRANDKSLIDLIDKDVMVHTTTKKLLIMMIV